MFKLSNIKKSPLTTIIGIVVIVTSIVSVFTHNMNWTEASVGIVLGAAFMGIKDPRMSNTVPVIVFLATGICYLGCSRKAIPISEQHTDSTWVKETVRIDTVHIPGDTVAFTVPCPDMGNAKTYHFKNKKATAKAVVKNGKVAVSCGCEAEKALLQSKEIEIGRLKKKTAVLPPEKIYKTYWYDYFCRTVTLISLIWLLITIIVSRIRVPNLPQF